MLCPSQQVRRTGWATASDPNERMPETTATRSAGAGPGTQHIATGGYAQATTARKKGSLRRRRVARSDPPPNVVSRLRNHATHGHPWPCACVACREDALEADRIGDDEECALHGAARDAGGVAPALRRHRAGPAAKRCAISRTAIGAHLRVQCPMRSAAWRETPSKIECEEGDLNPHGFYPTSPSN